MPKKIVFSAEQQATIVEIYESTSCSTRDIAKQFGVAYNTINSVLKSNGVKLAGNKKIAEKAKGNTYRKGYKASEETRARNSKASKGRAPTTLGKTYTPEERKRISEGLKKAFKESPTERVKLAREVGVEKINKARSKCKSLLRRVLKLTGRKKVTHTYDALGYTEKELISHISVQFKEGMSWEDRESFHIDHKTPVTWFIKNGITDPKVINALSNLQPLYPQENRFKSDKLEGLA